MSQPAPQAPLYDRIGTHYDVTRRADPSLVARLIDHLHPEPCRIYLDIACGTGNYTVAVAQSGIGMHGIDQSSRMIATARQEALTSPNATAIASATAQIVSAAMSPM